MVAKVNVGVTLALLPNAEPPLLQPTNKMLNVKEKATYTLKAADRYGGTMTSCFLDLEPLNVLTYGK
jgi:hypothetical protein